MDTMDLDQDIGPSPMKVSTRVGGVWSDGRKELQTVAVSRENAIGRFSSDVLSPPKICDSPKKAALLAAPPLSKREGSVFSSSTIPTSLPPAITSSRQSGTYQSSATAGVAHLLNQWSSILKQSSGQAAPAGGPPSFAAAGSIRGSIDVSGKPMEASAVGVEAMGPVFHNVLSNLTSEYERKLSAKDQDVTRAKDAISQLQYQLQEAHSQISNLQGQLSRHEAMQCKEEAESASSSELKRVIAELSMELSESKNQCKALQTQLDHLGSESDEKVSRLEAQTIDLMSRLEGFVRLEERFKAARDENRRLFNLVQDLKGAIRVYCRVRPPGRTGDGSSACLEVGEEGELGVHDPMGKADCKVFKFDKIFGPGSTQAEVYSDTQPLIRSVLDGYNVCIFAYGQTGSGKTHTMSGTNVEREDGRGINYRALDDLFSLVEERKEETQYTIRVQMLEIYNDNLRDLLVNSKADPPKLELLSTMPSGNNVRNVEQVVVDHSSQVLEIMAKGSKNRACAETNMNERSSRSHQVLTVIVDGTTLSNGAVVHSCLHLVDLAGSERVAKSGASGDRLNEACSINTSLSALGDVMAALARNASGNIQAHIPFRNSKLTQLLADSLSGQAKVMMFMHVAPEGNFVQETVSTLQFGSKVASVTLGQAKRNVDNSKAFAASEESSRIRKEVLERDDKILALHKRWTEEKSAKEHLAQEVERLKSLLQKQGSRATTSDGGAEEVYLTPSAHASVRHSYSHSPLQGQSRALAQSLRSPLALTPGGSSTAMDITPRGVPRQSPGARPPTAADKPPTSRPPASARTSAVFSSSSLGAKASAPPAPPMTARASGTFAPGSMAPPPPRPSSSSYGPSSLTRSTVGPLSQSMSMSGSLTSRRQSSGGWK